MEEAARNIWYLPGLMFQYNEDVKAFVRQKAGTEWRASSAI